MSTPHSPLLFTPHFPNLKKTTILLTHMMHLALCRLKFYCKSVCLAQMLKYCSLTVSIGLWISLPGVRFKLSLWRVRSRWSWPPTLACPAFLEKTTMLTRDKEHSTSTWQASMEDDFIHKSSECHVRKYSNL